MMQTVFVVMLHDAGDRESWCEAVCAARENAIAWIYKKYPDAEELCYDDTTNYSVPYTDYIYSIEEYEVQ